MTDCNAGSYIHFSGTSGDSVIWTDSGISSGDCWITGNIGGHDGYYFPVSQHVGTPESEQTNRKENDMIQRQTFLDALADEGKSVGSEGRDVVKEAKSDKWELFIARLLARAFENVDLAMLREKPKEVLVTTKEA